MSASYDARAQSGYLGVVAETKARKVKKQKWQQGDGSVAISYYSG